MKKALFLLLLLAHNALGATVVSHQAKIDLTTDKVAHIVGDVDIMTLAKFRKEMRDTQALPGDRLIIIDSRGGSLGAGEQILKIIREEKAASKHRVVCVANNKASSMAFNILSNCDVRLMTPGTHSLVHKIRRAIAGMSTALELRAHAKELDALDEPFRQLNARTMRLALADYDLFADKETVWRAEVLLKIGYLHGLATISE